MVVNAKHIAAHHHPAPEALAAWSAGALALSDALCITAHMEACDACRTHAQRLNKVGGDLLESQSPAPASSALKEQLLTRLRNMPAANEEPTDSTGQKAPASAASAPEWLPRCLIQFGIEDIDELDWKKQSGAISTCQLARDGRKKVELLRVKPGGSLSKHTHTGEETTLILTGSLSDEFGVYRAGDYTQLDGSHQHSTRATSDCECICLTVQEGPIQFTGPFMRLLNPFLRWRYATS